MGIIRIENIRLHAFHGCLEEEAVIGGEYRVDILIEASFEKAIQSDELTDTVDYVRVYDIVKREMQIRSKLIEHVAHRIGQRLKKEIPSIQKAEICVCKLRPPMNGDVDSVSVSISV